MLSLLGKAASNHENDATQAGITKLPARAWRQRMRAFLKPVLGALALGLSAATMAQNVTISVASFPDLDRGIKLAIPLYK